jgi:hypothetical protein
MLVGGTLATSLRAEPSGGAVLDSKPADVSQEQALQGAISGTPQGLAILRAWLGQAGGKAKQTADRAVALIRALHNAKIVDAASLPEVADRIAQTADKILQQVHIYKASIEKEVSLGEGRLGFVFQSPDIAVPAGFTAILPRDPRLRGVDLKALQSPVKAPILRAGIVGVQSVTLAVPNGNYRLILVTSDMGVANLDRSPFGTTVRVNDRTYEVAATDPEAWRYEAVIGSGGGGAATGGVLILAAAVRDGTLKVSFLNPAGETFISGLILEPLAQRSIVAGVADDDADIVVADASIEEAVGSLLSEITTAAGPQQPVPGFDLPATPDSLSPN